MKALNDCRVFYSRWLNERRRQDNVLTTERFRKTAVWFRNKNSGHAPSTVPYFHIMMDMVMMVMHV